MKVQISSAEKTVNFLAFDESGEVEVELELEGEGIIDSDCKEDSEGLYSLNFLESIIKIQSVIGNFNVHLGNNIPMKLEGKLDEEKGGRIVYLLAPRVENGNDDEFGEDFNDENLDNE